MLVQRGEGSSFGSQREAGESTISHGAASLVRMGLSGARGGLRFGARAAVWSKGWGKLMQVFMNL